MLISGIYYRRSMIIMIIIIIFKDVSLGLNYNMNSPLRIDVGNNLSFTIYIV